MISAIFKPLQEIRQGDVIQVRTSYGEFSYQVTDLVVANASAIGEKRSCGIQMRKLILYTCYPFGGTLQEKTQRILRQRRKSADRC